LTQMIWYATIYSVYNKRKLLNDYTT
jgi:hypothetical protein